MRYCDALAIVNSGKSMKIANNTVLSTNPLSDDIDIKLHGHPIITLHSDGRYSLNTCGFMTKTTKERMNRFTPFKIYQKNFRWFVKTSYGEYELVDYDTFV